jgi:hypothetical protein
MKCDSGVEYAPPSTNAITYRVCERYGCESRERETDLYENRQRSKTWSEWCIFFKCKYVFMHHFTYRERVLTVSHRCYFS